MYIHKKYTVFKDWFNYTGLNLCSSRESLGVTVHRETSQTRFTRHVKALHVHCTGWRAYRVQQTTRTETSIGGVIKANRKIPTSSRLTAFKFPTPSPKQSSPTNTVNFQNYALEIYLVPGKKSHLLSQPINVSGTLVVQIPETRPVSLLGSWENTFSVKSRDNNPYPPSWSPFLIFFFFILLS
jgi:hypothetical protein